MILLNTVFFLSICAVVFLVIPWVALLFDTIGCLFDKYTRWCNRVMWR